MRYGSNIDLSLERLEEIRDLNQANEYLERTLIARSLDRHGWNKSRAATELGISRQGLIKKIKRLQLVRPGAPGAADPDAGAEGNAETEGYVQPCLPFGDDED